MSPFLVYTDFACPFCYIGHRLIRKAEEKYGIRFRKVFRELHDKMPEEGCRRAVLIPDERCESINRRLQESGYQYEICPQIGDVLYPSDKAIRCWNYFTIHHEELADTYAESVYHAYCVEHRNIGDPDVLEELCRRVLPDADIQQFLSDEAADARQKEDKRETGNNFIQIIPTFQIGKKQFEGIMPFEDFCSLIETELEN